MRVIVTGSRAWRNGLLIREKLDDCLETCVAAGEVLIVVHGACRSGADAYADAWGRWQMKHGGPVVVEPHPARWEAQCHTSCRPGHRRPDERGWDICPQAGYLRNEEMVSAGAYLCLAFIADRSKGSTHCAKYAELAGIPVVTFRVTSGMDPLF